MTVVYELHNIIKRYGSRQVLNIDSLDIFSGEVFALVGPSGAGKSTLLRMLNFLEPATVGDLVFGGKPYSLDAAAPLEVRRRVTTVFQRPVLLDMSVWDNVALGLRLRGLRNSFEQINATLEQVGLGAQAQQRARTLSGGEAQRVALARALIIKPDVLLLDEPTANLDPANVSLIEAIIRRANLEHGMTCVLVTHNVFQAKRLASRTGLMLGGSLVEVAYTHDFFDAPADPRTAAFVRGEMVY